MKQYFEDIACASKQINWNVLYNKKVIVTGATGMIGRCVVDFLMWANENYDCHINVVAIGRNEDRAHKIFLNYLQKEHECFSFLKHDVVDQFDQDEFIGVDYIIHAASGATPNVFANNPVEVMKSNIEGIDNLLILARENNAKLLYVSSAELYGEVDKEDKCENDYGYIDHLTARAAYPISKKAAETLAISYSTEYNVESVICRLSHVFGPTMTDTDNRAASEFIRLGLAREKITVNNPNPVMRSYTYVVDAVSAMLFVLINGKYGEAYNIASGETILLTELAELVRFWTNVSMVIQENNKKQSGYTSINRQVVNIEKLKKLGWRPCFMITDGIKHTIDSLRG